MMPSVLRPLFRLLARIEDEGHLLAGPLLDVAGLVGQLRACRLEEPGAPLAHLHLESGARGIEVDRPFGLSKVTRTT